jgi:hypothetical protein
VAFTANRYDDHLSAPLVMVHEPTVPLQGDGRDLLPSLVKREWLSHYVSWAERTLGGVSQPGRPDLNSSPSERAASKRASTSIDHNDVWMLLLYATVSSEPSFTSGPRRRFRRASAPVGG